MEDPNLYTAQTLRKDNLTRLIGAARHFNNAIWLANVGCDSNDLIPAHFKNVAHVFGFSSNSQISVANDGQNYCFGHFSYELKNNLENLCSKNQVHFSVPNSQFFVPDILAFINNDGSISFESEAQKTAFMSLKIEVESAFSSPEKISLKQSLSKQEYVSKIKQIKQHIQLGDVYELNFCMEHFATDVEMNPIQIFEKMMEDSSAPFSVYYKLGDHHILCNSPERSIAKRNRTVYSQPMKGTTARVADADDNQLLMNALKSDPKERAENIMITDLVRNDLSKSAVKGSVAVDELCGVYPYGNVNQMISTVSCELRDDVTNEQAILNAFPMGSMTGAPKVRAMELIDYYEDFSRGMFSGSIGYFAPNGDFDFNVVIRSLIYNSKTKRLSCPTGGAITIKSDPEKEYDECLLKAEGIKKMLNGK